MNNNHATLCPSPEWAAHIQGEILPALTAQAGLGADMLEIGPGPGAATEWLRHRVRRLTVLEIDEAAAGKLAARYSGGNVTVEVGDAARLPFPDESFDTVGSFTMLHHVPTQAGQNAILAEALRVLRPGGVLIASDSLASNGLHHFHEGDTYHPVEPGSIVCRLQTIGFGALTIMVDDVLKFVARKPASASAEPDGAEPDCNRTAP
ncbi:MAG TPA: class I SAM-dependent methyltransferase [Streptosporangiaceae bacterium]